MMCAWKPLLSVLPAWLAREVDRYAKGEPEEIRLRLGQTPELVLRGNSLWLDRIVTADDLNHIINTASRYSPWAASTIEKGYVTAEGGHRIGVCGDAVIKNGVMTGIRTVHSLCIRVAKDYQGIGGPASRLPGSILLIGPPGSGKTTLLRDLARTAAGRERVAVVDERGELFPEGISRGRRMDVLTGCGKSHGIELLLRTMGPETVCVDEITSEADCDALVRAGWCGVRILATAHAASVSDLMHRPVYRPLVTCGLFAHILVLGRDKSWREERIAI